MFLLVYCYMDFITGSFACPDSGVEVYPCEFLYELWIISIYPLDDTERFFFRKA